MTRLSPLISKLSADSNQAPTGRMGRLAREHSSSFCFCRQSQHGHRPVYQPQVQGLFLDMTFCTRSQTGHGDVRHRGDNLYPAAMAPRVPEEMKAQYENHQGHQGVQRQKTICSGKWAHFQKLLFHNPRNNHSVDSLCRSYLCAKFTPGASPGPSRMVPPTAEEENAAGRRRGSPDHRARSSGLPALDSCSGLLFAGPGPCPPAPLSTLVSRQRSPHRSVVSSSILRGDLRVSGGRGGEAK